MEEREDKDRIFMKNVQVLYNTNNTNKTNKTFNKTTEESSRTLPIYEWEEDNGFLLRVLFHCPHPSPILSWLRVDKMNSEEYQVWNALDIWYKNDVDHRWHSSNTIFRETFQYYEQKRIFSNEILFQSLVYALFLSSPSESEFVLEEAKLRQVLGRFFLPSEVPTVYQMQLWKKKGKQLQQQFLSQEKKWKHIRNLVSSSHFSTFQKLVAPSFTGIGKTKTEIYPDTRPLVNIFWNLKWSSLSLPWFGMAVLYTPQNSWVVMDNRRIRSLYDYPSILERIEVSKNQTFEERIDFYFLPFSFPLLFDQEEKEEEKEEEKDYWIVSLKKGQNNQKTELTTEDREENYRSLTRSSSFDPDDIFKWVGLLIDFSEETKAQKEIRDDGEKGYLEMQMFPRWNEFLFREYTMVSSFQSMFRLIDKFPTLENEMTFLFRFPPYYQPPTLLPFPTAFSIKNGKTPDSLLLSLLLPLPKTKIQVWIFYLTVWLYDFSLEKTQSSLLTFHQEFLSTLEISSSTRLLPVSSDNSNISNNFNNSNEISNTISSPPPSTGDLGKVYPELFVKPTYKRFVCQKKQQPVIVSEEEATSIPEDKKLLFPLETISTKHPIPPQLYTCPNPEYPYPVLSKIDAPLIPYPEVYAPCCAKTPHPDKNKEALRRMFPNITNNSNIKKKKKIFIPGSGVEESKEGYHNEEGNAAVPKIRENRIGKAHIIKSVGQLGSLPLALQQWLEWYDMKNEYLRIGHAHGWFSLLHAVEYWFTLWNRPYTPKSEEELRRILKSKILDSHEDLAIFKPYVPFYTEKNIRALWEAYFDQKIFLPLTMVAKAVEMVYQKPTWCTKIVLFYRDKQDTIYYIDSMNQTMRLYNQAESDSRKQFVVGIYVHYGGGMNTSGLRGMIRHPVCELMIYQQRIQKLKMFSFPANFLTFLQSPHSWYHKNALSYPKESPKDLKDKDRNNVKAYEMGPLGNISVLHFQFSEQVVSAFVCPGTYLSIPKNWTFLKQSPFYSVAPAFWKEFVKQTKSLFPQLYWKQIYIYEHSWYIVCVYEEVEIVFLVHAQKSWTTMTTKEQETFLELAQPISSQLYLCSSSFQIPFPFFHPFDQDKVSNDSWITPIKKELANIVKEIVLWRLTLYLKEYYQNNKIKWMMDGEPFRPIETFFHRHVRFHTKPMEAMFENLSQIRPVMHVEELSRRDFGVLEHPNTDSEKVILPSLTFWKKCVFQIEWFRKNISTMSPEKVDQFWNVSPLSIFIPSVLQSYLLLSLQYPECNVLSPKSFSRFSNWSSFKNLWNHTPLVFKSLFDRSLLSSLSPRKSNGVHVPFALNFAQENPYYPYFAWVYVMESKKEAIQQWWFWKRFSRMPVLPLDEELLSDPPSSENIENIEKIILPVSPENSLHYLLLPPVSYQRS